MSQYTFLCPGCGQQLSALPEYAGGQTTCPACHRTITVPPAPPSAPPPGQPGPASPPPLSQSAPPPLSGASPVSQPSPPAAQPQRQRTSGLAIASLVCSIGSFICIPFGFIPGIICGHMARKDMARSPSVGGRGLASAGVIIGYISLVVHVLLLAGFVVFVLFYAH